MVERCWSVPTTGCWQRRSPWPVDRPRRAPRRSQYHLEAPGPTFSGRDIFAPVAAASAVAWPRGARHHHRIPPELLPGLVLSRREGDDLIAEVLWVDRYGNCQLNVEPDEVEEWGDRVEITAGTRTRVTRRVGTFADVGSGELGLVVDSYGLLALVADQASAGEDLSLAAGDEVTLRAVEADGLGVSVTSSVQIGRRGGSH